MRILMLFKSQCPNCDVSTKQEKLTGATYQVKVYSEQEVRASFFFFFGYILWY